MSKNEKMCALRKTSIGGQALIEGIMMRGPKVTAMAVRNTKGEIVIEKEPTQSANAPAFFKIPVIRGVYSFIYSMKTGSKYLMRSAELSGLEELEEEIQREKEAKKAAKRAAKAKNNVVETPCQTEINKTSNPVSDESAEQDLKEETVVEATGAELPTNSEPDKKKGSSALTTIVMTIGTVLGIALAIGLFVVLPTYIYDLIKRIPAIGNVESIALRSLYKSLFEGIIRVVLLVGYMAAISLMKDIRRTFMYHGAEHKTIFCYEAGLELTVENVKKQRRFHPRCGTSFLILMVLVSIFISFFIDPIYASVTGTLEMPTVLRIGLKLLLIPVIMGIGYELIKFAGKHDNVITRIISAPGVWLQHITVFEPTDDMIECAIAAVKEVIPDDGSDKW